MRSMATLRYIKEIKTHPNADALDLAVIDGWQCVVKKGEFKRGDMIVYLEIDSWVPNTVAPFLSKGKEPREYGGVKGERLRTVRLRGEVSQGLVLGMDVIPTETLEAILDAGLPIEGGDVSEILNITKWERPVPANLRGQARGYFPAFIRKTDQERIQNRIRVLGARQRAAEYEVTLKLDGSSCTFFVWQEEGGAVRTGVCSRNLELKTDESNADNAFVQMYHKLSIDEKLRDYHSRTGRSIAVQGELYGNGINGNWEGIGDVRYAVFDIFDCNRYMYISAAERLGIVRNLGLDHAPIIAEAASLDSLGLVTIDDFLAYAERPSLHAKCAEGVVFKSLSDPDFTFKVVSNTYLLSGGE